MSSVAMSCCLCLKNLAKDKRRRRKLHGPSCSVIKEELQKLSTIPIESLVEINNRDAYLCSICESKLRSIINLKQKLSDKENGIRGMLFNLRSVLGTPLELLRKRQLQESCNEPPPPKQPCLTSAVSTQDGDSEGVPSSSHTPTQSDIPVSHHSEDNVSPDVQVIFVVCGTLN